MAVCHRLQHDAAGGMVMHAAAGSINREPRLISVRYIQRAKDASEAGLKTAMEAN
jgi:hypothetical protein